jgi:hypothetical protein
LGEAGVVTIHEERHPGVPVERGADRKCRACNRVRSVAYRAAHHKAERVRGAAYRTAHPPTDVSRARDVWDAACVAYDKAESRLDETMQAYAKAKRKAGALATEAVV